MAVAVMIAPAKDTMWMMDREPDMTDLVMMLPDSPMSRFKAPARPTLVTIEPDSSRLRVNAPVRLVMVTMAPWRAN